MAEAKEGNTMGRIPRPDIKRKQITITLPPKIYKYLKVQGNMSNLVEKAIIFYAKAQREERLTKEESNDSK